MNTRLRDTETSPHRLISPSPHLFFLFLLCCVLCAFAVNSSAEDWPAWRGPRGDGTSSDTTVPTKWSATENVKWRVDLPGSGWGSPVVAGGKIFLNACMEKDEKRVLFCLDRADGKVLWQKEVLASPLERKNSYNSHASSTPLCDGQRVIVTFADINFPLDVPDVPPKYSKGTGRMAAKVLVACYDLEGKEIWKKHVGRFSSVHGFACSPIPYKDNVIVNCDHDGDGYMVCLRRSDGQEVWRVDRPNKTRSYCNPTIFEAGGKKQMVLSGTKCVTSYDPDTGKLNWMIDGPTEQFVAGMVFTDNTFLITGGFPQYHTLGISPDGKTVWHEKGKGISAYVPSPVAFDKWFFLITDDGRAVCYEAATGKQLWIQALGKHHWPSAFLANGNVYFLSDDGDCYIVKASDKYEEIAKNSIGEKCNATPAISNGQIFIRGEKSLWCIGKPAGN